MADRFRLLVLGLLAAALAVLVVAGAAAADESAPSEAPSESPSEAPSESPSGEPTPSESASPTEGVTAAPTTSGTVTVNDAVFRWGVNNESNNKAFAPRTFNFFSAGMLPDPGRGGVAIKQAQWQAAAGSTRIEKWNGSAWQPATWAGLSTDSSGVPLTSPTEGRFSNHTFVMTGGTGSVDPGAGTARIAWDADVTVLYYSGMSFFHLSDPVLDVAGGRGTVTALLHGFRSSQSDPGVWEEVPARRVVIADLPAVDVSGARGLVTTPAYSGVLVSGVPQVTGGAGAGSFPQSFVDYLGELGAAAFWYSSGASTDPYKVALPLSVSYDASVPVGVIQPSDQPTSSDDPSEVADPTAVPPPTNRPVPVAGAVPLPVSALGPVPLADVPAAAAGPALLARPSTDVRLSSATAAPTPATTSARLWWLGGGLLLAAALVLLVPAGRPGGVPLSRSTTRDASASP